jgi:site-specific recombinase XerD
VPATISDTAAEFIDANTLSKDRAAAYRRLLGQIESAVGPPAASNISGVVALLDAKYAAGISPSTIAKEIAMVKAVWRWMYATGKVNPDVLMAVLSIKPPEGFSRGTKPQPYRPKELKELRTRIDSRWPKMREEEALRWLRRVQEGRSPYSRVRDHAIRCQLDGVVALALHLGLRRREVYALDIHDMNHFNAGVAVYDKLGGLERARDAPMTWVARDAMKDWLTCRSFLGADHDRAWLNLHAGTTRDQPMTHDTFNKLLLTYVGRGWTLKRLRDTSAVGWVRSGLPLKNLRELLGLSRIEDTLPYAQLVPGSLTGEMDRLDTIFTSFVEPDEIAA